MSKTLAESGKREIVSFVSETFLEAKRALWDFRFFMCAFAFIFTVFFVLSLGDFTHSTPEQHKATVQITENSEKSAGTMVVPDMAPSKDLKPDQAFGKKGKNDPAVIVLALIVFSAAVLFIITGIYFCYALYMGRFARDGFSKSLFYNFLRWIWTTIAAWVSLFLLWVMAYLIAIVIAMLICATFIWLGSEQPFMAELGSIFKQGLGVWTVMGIILFIILSLVVYEYISARFSLASACVIAGEKSPIKKSLALTKGSVWRVFAGGFLVQTVLFIGLFCLIGTVYLLFHGMGMIDKGGLDGNSPMVVVVVLSAVNGSWLAGFWLIKTIYNCVVCKALKEEVNASSGEVL